MKRLLIGSLTKLVWTLLLNAPGSSAPTRHFVELRRKWLVAPQESADERVGHPTVDMFFH